MSEESKRVRRRVFAPRELLLVEVERYCRDPQCGARTATGLTKEEARSYAAFTCARCEREWADELAERDIPEWWEELRITSLAARRPAAAGEASDETEGPVSRLSDAWRAGREQRPGARVRGEDPSDGEDSF
jgi:hypothetical protein